jgi:hypothetical protein
MLAEKLFEEVPHPLELGPRRAVEKIDPSRSLAEQQGKAMVKRKG